MQSYRPHLSARQMTTHSALHIRNAHDAHVVLEAVRLGILPLIRRRLLASEREELGAGNVFVWEEAEDEGGLLRWTDGRRWSQSRMRGEYLFYEEKVETTQAEKDAKAARRARRAADPHAIIPAPVRRKDRPSKVDGLTKQTYSAVVNIPGTNQTRKWHVVAYFSASTYTQLPVIESYDYLWRIRVPEGMYLHHHPLTGKKPHFPPPLSVDTGGDPHHRMKYLPAPESPSTSSTSSLSPLSPHSPLPVCLSMPYSSRSGLVLPSLASLTGYRERSPFSRRATDPYPSRAKSMYQPLSSEDRRVLDRLRVVL